MDLQDIKDNWLKYLMITIVIIILIVGLIIATLQEPAVKSAEAQYKGAGSGYLDLTVTLRIENPNILGGILRDLQADVYKGDSWIGPASADGDYDVAAMDTSTIVVTLRVYNPIAVIDPGPYGADGTATIELWGQEFDIDFDTR